MQPVRPRRSVLYMPGSNARALEKARTLTADGFIFDLEDAVAPEAKAQARLQVADIARAGGFGSRERVIRINGLDTAWWRDDIAAAAAAGPDAVLLPKIEGAAQVRVAEAVMAAAGAPERMALWCMVETPKAVLKADEIAGASARLSCLVMGTSDLVKDLRARHMPGRASVLTALSLSLLAARTHGRAILDGVHLDLADDAGFVAACEQGRDLGFDGKTLIHPRQIDPCNRVFAPSAAEVDQARHVIAAFDAARAAGKGVVVVDGRLIENLHVEDARRVVALAAAIERLGAGG